MGEDHVGVLGYKVPERSELSQTWSSSKTQNFTKLTENCKPVTSFEDAGTPFNARFVYGLGKPRTLTMYHALCGPHGLVYITGKAVYQKSIQSVIMRFPSDIRDPRQIPNISMGRIPIFHRLYEGPLTINSIMLNSNPSDSVPSKFQSIPLWSNSTRYSLSTPHFPNFEWSHDHTPPHNYSPTTCCFT